MTEPERNLEDNEGHIWVSSEVTATGEYALTIDFTADKSVTLDEKAAVKYAMGILDAAHTSDYYAAVLRQLTKRGGLPFDTALNYIQENVKPYHTLSSTGTVFTLEPGMIKSRAEPFLRIMVDGQDVGDWSVDDAKEHARAVFDTIAVVRLDAAYYQSLIERLGVDEGRARGVVASIADFRFPGEGDVPES